MWVHTYIYQKPNKKTEVENKWKQNKKLGAGKPLDETKLHATAHMASKGGMEMTNKILKVPQLYALLPDVLYSTVLLYRYTKTYY